MLSGISSSCQCYRSSELSTNGTHRSWYSQLIALDIDSVDITLEGVAMPDTLEYDGFLVRPSDAKPKIGKRKKPTAPQTAKIKIYGIKKNVLETEISKDSTATDQKESSVREVAKFPFGYHCILAVPILLLIMFWLFKKASSR